MLHQGAHQQHATSGQSVRLITSRLADQLSLPTTAMPPHTATIIGPMLVLLLLLVVGGGGGGVLPPTLLLLGGGGDGVAVGYAPARVTGKELSQAAEGCRSSCGGCKQAVRCCSEGQADPGACAAQATCILQESRLEQMHRQVPHRPASSSSEAPTAVPCLMISSPAHS